MSKELLALRKKINKRRPAFRQQDSHRRGRLHPDKWRRPKGLHSTIKKNIWGKPSKVKTGFRGPAAVRGMDNNGLVPITIYNVRELENFDVKTNSVIVGNIGDRKRTEILNACKNKKITVSNVKDIDAAMKKITDKLAARKESKKKTTETKKAKAVKAAKKEEKTKDAEEQKKEEKKEMEKIVTKRD